MCREEKHILKKIYILWVIDARLTVFFSHTVKFFTYICENWPHNAHMAYWKLSDNSCQICVYQMKKRQARDSKDGNKQVGKKTEMISLNTVLFSRLCVCDSRDIGSSWCGKSPMERTAPSPWKLIMAQETPNATLNEMSRPGECHMNQRPSLRILRRLFVSAEEILLAAGRKNPDRLQQHGVCHTNISWPPAWMFFVCCFLSKPPEPKVFIPPKQCFSFLIWIKVKFAAAIPSLFQCVAIWAFFCRSARATIDLDVKNN